MQRSARLKPKSSVFKVHSNKFNVVDICKQVTLNLPYDFSFSMLLPSYSKNQMQKRPLNIVVLII